MTGLVEFLRARADEDEAAALAAPGRHWTAHTEDDVAGASVYDEQWVLLYPERYDHDKPMSNRPGATGPGYVQASRDELAAHIARHDPARVLAEVEARRRIIDRYQDMHWHAPAIPGATYPPLREEETGACRTCVTNKLLALPHSDHPDYRPEWRP